ncbi:MAG: hypothetical protein ACKO41_04045 [Sphingomonadales bacterium]
MKNYLVPFLLIIMILSLGSCSKSHFQNEKNATASLLRVENFKTSADIEIQKYKYSLLTAQEKYNIWAAHLQKGKIQFLQSAQFEKSASVDHLLANLTVSVFSSVSTRDRDIFFNYFISNGTVKPKIFFLNRKSMISHLIQPKKL